ncbi:uncharacterized protein LY89DRAFT_70599 [Mollisia scopiformis]|uniref:Uncharacterized protein n=1 Tax=Mollisia scopiformis TaxID=149040 RepID=A0A194XBC2_MOLSC|nr:uncharacterized protein LY89DRAFT_70599 [Mollisia scopiformis]KUJ17057.1 hypothetical protein LY89DRAFT_70599 [Mollisia scopiformis]
MWKDRLLRFFGRNPKKHKGVSGYIVAVEIFKTPSDELHPLSLKAAYVPTYKRHRMSQALAQKMDLNIDKDGMAEALWKEQTANSKSFVCKSRFIIIPGLPWDVVFGDYDSGEMFRGWSCPFQGATKHDFGDTLELLNDPAPQANPWAKFTQRTMSWASFDRIKDTSRRSSFPLRTSRRTPTMRSLLAKNSPNPGNVAIATNGPDPRVALVSSQNRAQHISREGGYRPGDQLQIEETSLKVVLSNVTEEAKTPPEDTNNPNSIMREVAYRSLKDGPPPHLSDSTERKQGSSLEENFPINSDLAPVAFDTLSGGTEKFQNGSIEQQNSQKLIKMLTSEAERREATTPQVVLEPTSKVNVAEHVKESRKESANVNRKRIAVAMLEAREQAKIHLEQMRDVKAGSSTGDRFSSSELSLMGNNIWDSPKTITRHTVSSDGSSVPPTLRAAGPEKASRVGLENLTLSDVVEHVGTQFSETAEIPPTHSELASYKVKQFLEQDAEENERATHSADPGNGSAHTSTHEAPRPRRIKNQRNLPKIRRAKAKQPTAATNLDVSAPHSDDYWTWDDTVKQHFHVDSDTQSIVWYEDSESDSEGSLKSNRSITPASSPVDVPTTHQNF